MAGSRPFRAWAPEPRWRESRPFLFPPQARDGSHRQSRCTKKDVGREELPAEIGPSDSQSKGEVRDGSMLSKKSFGANKRNILKLLMRFVRSDVGTTSCLRKTTTSLRIGTTEHRSGGVVQKSPFARFLASFDFRLFRQDRPIADINEQVFSLSA